MASLNYLRCGFFACALVSFAFPLNVAAQAAALASNSGAQAKTITGRVSNAATGARLEGARVELQGTGRAVMTDPEGRYFITATPADTALVVSYVGLDPVTIPLASLDGVAATKDVALSAEIYRMQAFRVEGDC